MDRFELILWMDAVASLWPRQDYPTQKFAERWWWDLKDALAYEILEFCPGMWAQNGRRVS